MRHPGKSLVLLALVGAVSCGGDGGEAAGGAPDEMTSEPYPSDTLGAVQVTSASPSPRDWFEVLQGERRAYSGAPPMLGGTVELTPGSYELDVNHTRRTVTIEAGHKLIVRTGDILVTGEPEGAYWYPMQGTERRITSNPSTLNAQRAFFAGDFEVFVNEGVGVPVQDLGVVQVLPGRVTTVQR